MIGSIISKLSKIWRFFDRKKEREEKTPVIVGVGEFMCKACELAKVVINECYDREYPISTAKLQKLLVLMHGEHLAEYGKKLFDENVVCWRCGVAIKEIELKFLFHDFAKKDKLPVHIAVLKSEEDIMQRVLDKYGKLDVLDINNDYRLNELILLYPYKEGERVIIPNETIKRVFLNYGTKM